MITRDEIIRMAREAGFGPAAAWNEYAPLFERFFHAAYAAGAKAEREVCAKLVEPTEEHRRDASWGFLGGAEGVELLDEIVATIRARSEK